MIEVNDEDASKGGRLGEAIALAVLTHGSPTQLEKLLGLMRLDDIVQTRPDDSVVDVLHRSAHAIDWAQPVPLEAPDFAHTPLLICVEHHGWGVILDTTPDGGFTMRRPLAGFLSACRERPESLAQGHGLSELVDDLVVDAQQTCESVYWLKPSTLNRRKHGRSFQAVLRRALGGFRGAIAEAVLGSVMINLLAIATSLFALQVYDKVIPTRSSETLTALTAGVLLFIIFEWLMKFARTRVMERVVVGLDRQITRSVFERLLDVRLDRLPGQVGSLAAQVRSNEQVRAFYTASTLFSLVDIPSALIFVAIISLIASPMIALVPLVLGLIAILIGLLYARRLDDHAKGSAAASYRKTGLLVEAVEGAETIKQSNGRWRFLREWLAAADTALAYDLATKRTTDMLQATSLSIQQSGYVATVAIGATLVMSSDITMGALIATSILGGRVLGAVMAVPNLLVQRAQAKAATNSIQNLYDLEPDNAGIDAPLVPRALTGAYSCEKLGFAYDDGSTALNIERLQIASGERVGVVGPIGSGKSTLLRLLAGLYVPTDGRVLHDGLDMSHIAREVVATQIGYLSQDHRLFEGSLRDNLLLGAGAPSDTKVIDAMKQTGLDRVIAAHTRGIERPIHEGGKGLSGGQRQLVGFTRLLLRPFPVLILDEPTASMDEGAERTCAGILSREHLGGRTLIMATHKPSLLPLVDRLLVLHNGGLIMDGPREAVLTRLSAPKT